jgi:hypothetical protein
MAAVVPPYLPVGHIIAVFEEFGYSKVCGFLVPQLLTDTKRQGQQL